MACLFNSGKVLAYLCVFGVAIAAAPSGWGKDCRDDSNVKLSADVDKNTGMCGHLTAHILNEQLPPNETHKGRSVFVDRQQFLTVWNHYVAAKGIKEYKCAKDGGHTIAVTKLKLGKNVETIKAYSCTDDNCTTGHKEGHNFSSIAFWYRLVEAHQKGCDNPKPRWILVSAHPADPVK